MVCSLLYFVVVWHKESLNISCFVTSVALKQSYDCVHIQLDVLVHVGVNPLTFFPGCNSVMTCYSVTATALQHATCYTEMVWRETIIFRIFLYRIYQAYTFRFRFFEPYDSTNSNIVYLQKCITCVICMLSVVFYKGVFYSDLLSHNLS